MLLTGTSITRPLTFWYDWRRSEIDTSIGAEWVVVVHDKHNNADEEYPSESGRRQAPLVDRNPEYLENRHAEPSVDEDEQQFHQ